MLYFELLSQPASHNNHMSENQLMFPRNFVVGDNMLVWHNQNMDWRNWMSVLECCQQLVLVKDLSLRLTSDYLTELAI